MSIKETSIKNRQIKRLDRRIKSLEDGEAKIRKNWTKQYNKHLAYTQELINRSKKKLNPDNKKALQITSFLEGWEKLSIKLTNKRNLLREKIQTAKDEKDNISLELKELQLSLENDAKANNSLIDLIFTLNNKVVDALEERNNVLSENVYNRLVKADGNLHSQLSLINEAATRKVVALVNSITLVKPEMAEAGKIEIQKFFNRYEEKLAPKNPTIHQLYKLTQGLLIDKSNFKIGPSFYVFISMDINQELFPELVKAQEFLKASIRSEKTNSYIRLYERENRQNKWIPIKQE